jgi:threonylcarbamoyladenosine tRNA methylthiotransferase MtaB
VSYNVSFQTFGCKLNQLETESLASSFGRFGATVLSTQEAASDGREVELHVFNTCTVTGKAEQKARHAIRSALAAHPSAVVIVTGCYAQVDEKALAGLDGRVVVVKGEDKARLHGLAEYLGEEWQGHGELLDAIREWLDRPEPGQGHAGGAALDSRFAFSPESFAFHSRPSLKIEDGCNNRCSYCRVCLARGPALSLSPELVLERLLGLEEAGAAEVVLTGVNLSQYRSGGLDFPGLLRYLLAGSSRIALRLSSYEPDRIDAAFLEAFSEPRIRPHMHLAVQSGSDAVLAAMGRHYGGRRVIEACEAMKKAKGDPFLAADFIAGFPGESEADFTATLEVAKASGFAWIHAFPFSARPGTPAYSLRPKVPERVAGERVASLTALAIAGRSAYASRWVGAEVEAVVERPDGEASRATSENYLRLELRGGLCPRATPPGLVLPGQAIRCRIEGLCLPSPAETSQETRADAYAVSL